ncbi:MAG TPA: precorrin-6y C5,15-methyltransferase (decarboxylating) subunit CbiE [Devosia sp.]|nr:precorrin-6y C5,15-methyltransferase (decarboxylating) subunit CbiE [Devosia sp.]
MTAWLDIVGVGEGHLPPLPPGRTVLGPKRLKARVPQLVEWEQPTLETMLAQILRFRGTPTVVLASGDPMWFGIGATLSRHLSAEEFRVDPAPSAFQLAAARLGWPLQHVVTLSLHGRPGELILPHVTPGNRILALTTDKTTAPHVARLLSARGYGRSVITVLESLGGPEERVLRAEALGFDLRIEDFYVLAVDCVADPGATLLPPVPGLPDDAFISDGTITKREIRAATLGRLMPYPGALLWDVGAGCGSVAVEWMRAARDARAIAFEREGERLQMIAVNADRLGVPGLRIESGEAPQSLVGMPEPDAIFLGGGVSDEALFHACWTALRRGGRLVANAVTIEGEHALYARQARLGGELVRIEVAVLDTLGEHRALRPRMAVTQWAVHKP